MRDVVGYEGLYKVTSCGKIWSCRRNKFLVIGDFNGNYQMVTLVDADGKGHNDYVHRIVAKAYVPNPDNLPEVNHIDEVKNHNWAGNLEWCTRNYNMKYSNCTGTSRSIPVYCVELDRTFPSTLAAAKELGLQQPSISGCIRGLQKTTGGYHWRYAN